MRNRLLLFFFIALVTAPFSARADHAMVLIVSKDSAIQNISSIGLRKMYLGFTVTSEQGATVTPVTNTSDSRLWQVFLQDVMGMTDRSYDRRLLTLTLQSGRARPAVAADLDSLIHSVASNQDAISFAWLEDIEDRDDIRVLRVLWQD